MTLKNKDYIDDLISDPMDDCHSEVLQYYAGRNILITGGSGFFGILLIERLLRCCSDLGKMYVLMREKKGKSAEERFKQHFDNVVYDKLKKEQPNFISKIIMIEADFGEINLGLSPENRKRLLDTNVIFHLAATVRFNEAIRVAVNINVRGTREILLLAREMTDLKAFVYVSTAFSYCVNKFIEEKFYTSPLETNAILTLLDILDNETLDIITPMLIGEWPNTYMYTKAIAEDTVRQYSVELPVCVVRPSIVVTTAKEPITGWINNLYGPVGVVMGSGLGLLRTLHCMPENTADLVPADYVIANIIVAGWDTAQRKDTLLSVDDANPKSRNSETERALIYNCVSSNQNPITWAMFMKYNEQYSLLTPFMNMLWCYVFTLNRYRLVHNIYALFLHTIPAVIVDVLAFLTGRKPKLLKTYKKIHVFTDSISYFTTRQWQFRNDAVVKLWDRLNPTDRKIFDFNVAELSWDEFIKHMILGLRIYIAKDPEDTLKQARLRYKKLMIAHYTLLTVVSSLLIWITVNLINLVISFFS
ncbi:fatty acyl-CoA reductase wat-like [Odontomachus brunneus]|uniref:fatty acyl-CoA reductase wat-like n=1 Tax=Odontomachus brunneus TaxID=486640 RepID=UPI0013F1D770|nr:fatty acyl-CoA reductase wat-like [Odontomachus brunneus]XP_032674187.1 fatty acyl-CoA reductase wat-like [Odontomachus brunneus]XP_032674188.1 fatty acyl-CoA reductase wat-like [Odontomachus brunneus]